MTPPRRGKSSTGEADPYLVNLRRELTLALARLKRAERERDAALAAASRLRKRLAKRSAAG
jgi:hypothetical protein